ncbi:MAG: lysine--tRNA ligase [Patescibacteria group bacterium]
MIPEEVARRERLASLQKNSIDAYPAESNRTHTIASVLLKFDEISTSGEEITVTGRLKAIRKHGGVTFIVLQDTSGSMQMVLHRDTISNEVYSFFHEHADVGDFFEFTGPVFRTKKGEQSIHVSKLRLLSKSLLPLPEKWHGLTDTETRYRQRYLDLIANPSVFAKAMQRSLIVKAIRQFLDSEGFTEVETPVLQPIAGGAAAKPFVTHHNTLHTDLYLRIAPELYLKRLLVGGFEKVFEFARCFRNEGISPQHNPEFTQIETYWAYATIEDLMDHLERMFDYVIKNVLDSETILLEGQELNFSIPFKRQTFHDAVLADTGIDLDQVPDETSLKAAMEANSLDTKDKVGYAELVDHLYKEKVRPNIIQPTFITDYPAAMKPLAKKRGDSMYSASAQLVVCGMEVLNAFNEQNDPLEQEAIFNEQEVLRDRGSEEAQAIDHDFLTALKHGMPPAAGYGVGIDRLVSILTSSSNLKEVILFPALKPEIFQDASEESGEKDKV